MGINLFVMPEAFAVVAVFVVAIVAWVGAWMHARNPANFNARDESERLRQHAQWVEQRLERAQRERWGDEMMAALHDERATLNRQIADTETRGRMP